MPTAIRVFKRYIDALSFAASGARSQYFECSTEADSNQARNWVQAHVRGVSPLDITGDIASTLAAWAVADLGTTCAYVSSEADHGSVIAHYTSEGEVVRFLGMSVDHVQEPRAVLIAKLILEFVQEEDISYEEARLQIEEVTSGETDEQIAARFLRAER